MRGRCRLWLGIGERFSFRPSAEWCVIKKGNSFGDKLKVINNRKHFQGALDTDNVLRKKYKSEKTNKKLLKILNIGYK